jgi:NAD(P)-dependent dehydrogenase (short-subunit alcohol dehydrogenase family)
VLERGHASVITGGASGIGRGIAALFAREGARVAILDRDVDRARAFLAELDRPADGDHVVVAVDVASAASVEAAFADVDAALPRIHSLVNCAGVRGIGDPLEVEVQDWEKVIAVNLSGSFYCAQQAGRRMAAHGGGSIVNIASVAAMAAAGRRVAYNASKAGVVGLTQSLALDLGDRGIRVNAVCPGMIRTPLTEPYFANEAWVAALAQTIPLRRAGAPEEIADAVAFLAGNRSSYISGVALAVDGGLLSSRPLGSPGAYTADRPPA